MVLNRCVTACRLGGPQLGIVMHKWATALEPGGLRTFLHFENGFACRMRLRNTSSYELSYGPVSVNWRGHPENRRGNDLFLEIIFTIILSYAYPSDIEIITLMFILMWAAKIYGLLKWAATRKRLRNTALFVMKQKNELCEDIFKVK